ncbi:MAG: phosphonate metabolism protein/1,5-bisphosphokinase (PRPP-forming) PhnN [Desulfovermiculus sp.]
MSQFNTTRNEKGILLYLMGPSGAGKDTLLNYLRQHRPPEVFIARRYITRPHGNSPEDHLPLTKEEFLARKESGFFSFTWQAHGCWYGISRDVELWLHRGKHVLINGSRHAYALARDRFMPCQGILIQADPDIIRARLEARGREDAQEVAKRLERVTSCNIAAHDLIVVHNNHSPEQGGTAFLRRIEEVLLRSESANSSCRRSGIIS